MSTADVEQMVAFAALRHAEPKNGGNAFDLVVSLLLQQLHSSYACTNAKPGYKMPKIVIYKICVCTCLKATWPGVQGYTGANGPDGAPGAA